MATDLLDKSASSTSGRKLPSPQELEWLNKLKASIRKDINLGVTAPKQVKITGKATITTTDQVSNEGGDEALQGREEKQYQNQGPQDDQEEKPENKGRGQEPEQEEAPDEQTGNDGNDQGADEENEEPGKKEGEPEGEEGSQEDEDDKDEEPDDKDENEEGKKENKEDEPDDQDEGNPEEGEPTEGAGDAEDLADDLAGEEAAGEGAALAVEGVEAAEAAEAAGAAAEGTGIVVATSEVWVPVLVVVAAIVGLIIVIMIFFAIATAKCNEEGVSGTANRAASTVASWAGIIPADVCAQLAIQNSSGGKSGGGGATVSYQTAGDAEARAQLLSRAGITVNKPQPATSLEGISQAALDEIVNFALACNRSVDPAAAATANRCGVILTGGTETTGGHSGGACSHLSGNKFDMTITSQVDGFIQKPANFTPIQNRGSDGAAQYRNNSTGVVYAREGNHWDVGGVGC